MPNPVTLMSHPWKAALASALLLMPGAAPAEPAPEALCGDAGRPWEGDRVAEGDLLSCSHMTGEG